jgi:hypothetical protein
VIIPTLPGDMNAAVYMRVDHSIYDFEVWDAAQRDGWNDTESNDSGSDDSGESSSAGESESVAGVQFAAMLGSIGLVGMAVAVFGIL